MGKTTPSEMFRRSLDNIRMAYEWFLVIPKTDYLRIKGVNYEHTLCTIIAAAENRPEDEVRKEYEARANG